MSEIQSLVVCGIEKRRTNKLEVERKKTIRDQHDQLVVGKYKRRDARYGH